MINTIDKIQENIYYLFSIKSFKQCIGECNNLIDIVNSNLNLSEMRKKSFLWFAYFRIALSYKRMGNYENSILFTEKSSFYSYRKEQSVQQYWLLGLCYEELNYDLACENYDIALSISQENEYIDYTCQIYANKAGLTGNEVDIYKALDLAKKYYKDYEYLFDAVFENWAKIHIKNNQIEKAKRMLHRIKNKDIYDDVYNRYFIQPKVG